MSVCLYKVFRRDGGGYTIGFRSIIHNVPRGWGTSVHSTDSHHWLQACLTEGFSLDFAFYAWDHQVAGTVAINVGFYGKGDTQRMLIAVNDALPWHWDCMFTFYAYPSITAAGFPLDTIYYCRNGERFARSAFLAEEWSQLSVSAFDGGKQFHVVRVLTADEVECVFFTENDVTAGKMLVAEEDNNEEAPQRARDRNMLKAQDDRAIIACTLISRWTDDYLVKGMFKASASHVSVDKIDKALKAVLRVSMLPLLTTASIDISGLTARSTSPYDSPLLTCQYYKVQVKVGSDTRREVHAAVLLPVGDGEEESPRRQNFGRRLVQQALWESLRTQQAVFIVPKDVAGLLQEKGGRTKVRSYLLVHDDDISVQ